MQRTPALTSIEARLRAGEMTPLHAHDMEESFLVLDGSLIVHAGGETARLGAGRTLTVPAGVAHALVANVDTRYLACTYAREADRYADFMRAVAVPGGDGPADDDAVIDFLARANGITLHGPPGTLPGR